VKVTASVDVTDFLADHLEAWDVAAALKDAIKREAVKEIKASPEYRRMVDAAKKTILDKINAA
jgi:hypothetical protein